VPESVRKRDLLANSTSILPASLSHVELIIIPIYVFIHININYTYQNRHRFIKIDVEAFYTRYDINFKNIYLQVSGTVF